MTKCVTWLWIERRHTDTCICTCMYITRLYILWIVNTNTAAAASHTIRCFQVNLRNVKTFQDGYCWLPDWLSDWLGDWVYTSVSLVIRVLFKWPCRHTCTQQHIPSTATQYCIQMDVKIDQCSLANTNVQTVCPNWAILKLQSSLYPVHNTCNVVRRQYRYIYMCVCTSMCSYCRGHVASSRSWSKQHKGLHGTNVYTGPFNTNTCRNILTNKD